ncbi:YheT family hydrolase [Gemmatimonas aurantiaca]|nr:alpha/beta fold hydrolase [Gemmatimonas aurantiaca]
MPASTPLTASTTSAVPGAAPPPTRPYRAAWWLPDPHSATIWGRVGRREPPAPTHIERWDTPDGDFVDLVRLAGARGAQSPRLLLLHGLEGGVHSHYVRALFREARSRGWAADLLLFRSCGSEPNRLPRSYHSGETGDARWVLDQLTSRYPSAPIGLVGVSLGGNVLCKLLGEERGRLSPQVTGAVAISVPFDLARASRRIGQGFGVLYEHAFLRSLIPKAQAKVRRHPELRHLQPVSRIRTLWDFDDAFTAPVHGFADAADYYARSSSLPYLSHIARPTLLLSAVDDPFLPADVLDEVREAVAATPCVEAEFPVRGGHVGFTAGGRPWAPWYYAEWRAAEFLRPGLEGWVR